MSKVFKFNIKKTLDSTASDSVFVDVKPDSSVRMRLLPPTKEDGDLWYMTASHFGLLDEEGKTRAPACGKVHGDGECFFCELADYLEMSSDKGEAQLGKDLSANHNWYAQVLVATKAGEKDGQPVWEYSDPKLIRMTQTTAKKVNGIIQMQYDNGDEFLFDVENGQDITLKRTGAQKATRYEVMAVGKRSNLNVVKPGWEDQLLDVPARLKAVPPTTDDAIAAAVRTFGDRLDWDAINEELGG